jgi:hypothetical protein
MLKAKRSLTGMMQAGSLCTHRCTFRWEALIRSICLFLPDIMVGRR